MFSSIRKWNVTNIRTYETMILEWYLINLDTGRNMFTCAGDYDLKYMGYIKMCFALEKNIQLDKLIWL